MHCFNNIWPLTKTFSGGTVLYLSSSGLFTSPCMISADVLAWALVLEPAGDSCRESPDWQEGWLSFWMRRRDSSQRSAAVQHCCLVVKIWVVQRLDKVNKRKTQLLYCLLPFVLEILAKIMYEWEETKLQTFWSHLANDAQSNATLLSVRTQYWRRLYIYN